MSVLDIDRLHLSHPGEPPIAAGWSAAIGPGVTLLWGDTGSGKTTLLRALAGQLPADGGLRIGAAALATRRDDYLRELFFADLSEPRWDPLPVDDCVAALHGDDPRFDRAAFERLAEAFSLAPHRGKSMFMLSTGSRRKVGLATALATARPLTLLDEPTSGLDAASVRALWAALAALAAPGDGAPVPGVGPARAVVVASGERIGAHVPLAATFELPLAARVTRT